MKGLFQIWMVVDSMIQSRFYIYIYLQRISILNISVGKYKGLTKEETWQWFLQEGKSTEISITQSTISPHKEFAKLEKKKCRRSREGTESQHGK